MKAGEAARAAARRDTSSPILAGLHRDKASRLLVDASSVMEEAARKMDFTLTGQTAPLPMADLLDLVTRHLGANARIINLTISQRRGVPQLSVHLDSPAEAQALADRVGSVTETTEFRMGHNCYRWDGIYGINMLKIVAFDDE